MRKYVNHARQIKPVISDDLNHKIVDWFIDNRGKDDFHINFRHYEAIRRLSVASAKARLSVEVNKDDVKRALRLFGYSLDTLGVQDIDSISTGITRKDRFILRAVEGILPAYWNDILHHGFDEPPVKSLIAKGYLYENKKDNRVYPSKEKT